MALDSNLLKKLSKAAGGDVIVIPHGGVSEKKITKWHNRNLNALGELIPEEQDRNVLFRRNWLARGQAFALVASAGVGKSSMADQMALHWAIGRPFLAEPIRPMRIAMIQFEDSDRDLQEQRDGMIRGMAAEEIPKDEISEAIGKVDFSTDFIGMYGDKFIKTLHDYQGDNRYDLLMINPLQRCFGEDVSDQSAVSQFCGQIDSIIKDPEIGCGCGIVMHTPKFHSGNRDARQSVDDYAEYAMAGSQEWTAWIRAVINFQKHGSSEDYFDVRASKRGKRLGWKDADGNAITKRIFKHSDGFIYWQEVTDPEEIAAIPDDQANGRPKKDDLDVGKCAHAIANQYRSEASGQVRNAFMEHFWRKEGQKHRKADYGAVFDELVSNADEYGFRVQEVMIGNHTKQAVLL